MYDDAKSVSIYIPALTKNQRQRLFSNVSLIADEMSFNVHEKSQDNEENSRWFHVDVENYRDIPNTVIGRGHIDDEDPLLITLEIYNPECIQKILNGKVEGISVIFNGIDFD